MADHAAHGGGGPQATAQPEDLWPPSPDRASSGTWQPTAAAEPGPVPVRAMTLGEVLDGAFKLLRADLGPIVLVTGAVIVPTSILATVLQFALFGDLLDAEPASPGEAEALFLQFAETLPTVLGAGLVQALVLLVGVGAATAVSGARFVGGRVAPGAALKVGLRRTPALLGAGLLATLGVGAVAAAAGLLAVLLVEGLGGAAGGVGAAVLGLAGFLAVVWLYVSWALFVPAIVLEGAGPVRALGRSRQLVAGRWWPTFGTILLAFVVLLIAGTAVSVVPTTAAEFVPGDGATIALTALGSVLSSLVTLPGVTLIVMLVYANQRIRKEGLDLQLRGGADPA